MRENNRVSRRTVLKSISLGTGVVLGPGMVSGTVNNTKEKVEYDRIREEVLKEWRALIRRHGAVSGVEYGATDGQYRSASNENIRGLIKKVNKSGESTMIHRYKFEDGYTTNIITKTKQNGKKSVGSSSVLKKKIDGKQFKTTLNHRWVDELGNNWERQKNIWNDKVRETVNSEFANDFNPNQHKIRNLTDQQSVGTHSSSYHAYKAEDGNSNKDCPGPCWLQGINFATDVDTQDNRCGVSVTDAVVSIEADAYAEVYSVYENNANTGEFEVTFDGYTKGTLSSLFMAGGVKFLGFVRNVDSGETDAIQIGTLDANWYDAGKGVDTQWGPSHGAGPGGDAPYTDYKFDTDLKEGETYAFGIRMEINLANLSLPGAITINFTDTNNPLDDGYGMSYDWISLDW